jgi:hypothetical protein
MKNTFGSQQGDAWLRNRCGRVTASRIVDVCSYLKKASVNGVAGDPSAKRKSYFYELISERLTGRTAEHYNSPAMQRGNDLENDARLYYEQVMRVMCEPVNFVLHPEFDFTGASPDSLVGREGMLEIKCLLPWNHVEVLTTKKIGPERFAQVGWQLACGGEREALRARRWVDLVHFCPDIQGCDRLRFAYQRIGRDELEWTVGSGKEEVKLTGEAVIDYFTSEVLKLNAEIEYFFAEREATPVAPFPVQVLPDEDEARDALTEEQAFAGAMEAIDRTEMTP